MGLRTWSYFTTRTKMSPTSVKTLLLVHCILLTLKCLAVFSV